jgi:hypothetical protein
MAKILLPRQEWKIPTKREDRDEDRALAQTAPGSTAAYSTVMSGLGFRFVIGSDLCLLNSAGELILSEARALMGATPANQATGVY